MIKHNQSGAASGLLVSLILTVILLLGAIGFGAWAFSSRQDYKDNADAKINTAVQAAITKNSAAKDVQFAEELKNPLTTYNGPETLGSVVLQYPKTWGGYDNSATDGSSLDIYFNPRMISMIGNPKAIYALHMQVLNQPYSNVLQSFAGQQQAGQLVVKAYSLPKLPKVVGIKATGTFADGSSGTVVVMPIRSQTLEVETSGSQFLNDFNNYVLKNLSFSP